MARVRLELERGYEKELLRSHPMRAMLNRAAEAAAAEARRSAPVGNYTGGGRYRDNIKAEAGFDDKGDPVGRVNAHYFTSWWIEAGTSRMRARPVLRNAIESGATRRALS